MTDVDVRATVPLPALASLPAHDPGTGSAVELVRAFVSATAALSADTAAQLAAVRTETLRKWRRRAPRWLKADTARRLTAYLAGEVPAPAPRDEGFRRAFHQRLRLAPPE
ncbi:MAG TPA: hypothetical protein VLK84_23745 [Longimicrobium sp.]|nr:hypothetical protein [Longimicrobium sp.]